MLLVIQTTAPSCLVCRTVLPAKDASISRHSGQTWMVSWKQNLDGFMETVEAAWTSVPARPCPLETLSLKLKATARRLQSWSPKSVGHLNSQLFLAKEILHQLDIAQDSRTLQPNELWLRNNLKKHSLVLASLLRTVARIRSLLIVGVGHTPGRRGHNN